MNAIETKGVCRAATINVAFTRDTSDLQHERYAHSQSQYSFQHMFDARRKKKKKKKQNTRNATRCFSLMNAART